MADLVAWLTQILDEDEEAANLLGDRVWFVDGEGVFAEPTRVEDPWREDAGEYERDWDGDYHLQNRHTYWRRVLDPAAVLADIAAKRAIIALHQPDGIERPVCTTCATQVVAGDLEGDPWPCPTARLLASGYAARPGYDEEWRP